MEGVIELFSHRYDRASRIVLAFVVGDCNNEMKTQGEKHLCSCVDAVSGVRSPEAAVLPEPGGSSGQGLSTRQ